MTIAPINLLFICDENGLPEVFQMFQEEPDEFRVTLQESKSLVLKGKEADKYDLILYGCSVENLEGIALLKNAKEKFGDIPTILLTCPETEKSPSDLTHISKSFYLQNTKDPCFQYTKLKNTIRQVIQGTYKEDIPAFSEDKFLTVFMKNPVAMTLVSVMDGFFTDANEAFLKGTGYERSEIIGFTAEQIGLFPDPAEYSAFVINLRKTHSANGVQLRCRIKCGEIRICRFSSNIIHINGRPQVLSTVEDITERKQVMNAIRESADRYRLILQNAQEGIMVNELTPMGPGRFLDVNDAACKILGMRREELEKIRLTDLDTPEMNKRAPEIIKEIIRTGHHNFQTNYLSRNREERFIEVSVSLFTLKEKPTMLSIVRDVTERKRSEAALQQANKKLSLLSRISRHDIGNQLMILGTLFDLVHMKCADPDSSLYFSHIEDVLDKVIQMIRFTGEYEQIGVHSPVWQSISTLIEKAGETTSLGEVRLTNTIRSDIEIFADPLIVKVFFNLIENALRHGGTVTTITFLHEMRDSDIIILCTDDGVGIQYEEKELIFQREFGKNTGLGLYLSREILDITGIVIRETGEPGKGSKFEIIVPERNYRILNSE